MEGGKGEGGRGRGWTKIPICASTEIIASQEFSPREKKREKALVSKLNQRSNKKDEEVNEGLNGWRRRRW